MLCINRFVICLIPIQNFAFTNMKKNVLIIMQKRLELFRIVSIKCE